MKNPFSLKCFDITEAIQEGINELSQMAGYKQMEVQKPIPKKRRKNYFSIFTAFVNFLKL